MGEPVSMPVLRTFPAFVLCLWLAPGLVVAAEVRVAVAANFASTLRLLAAEFAAASGHRLLISPGSTGKHYAQIRNGAAFDVFLAADAEHPMRLEEEGSGIAGSRFPYAEGRLVLWAPGKGEIREPAVYLASDVVRRIAIANPRLAPYGQAAQQVLEAWGLWETLQGRLVRGENVAQAYQFVATGNAEAGLVALSQLLTGDAVAQADYRVLPETLYRPIAQHALLLRRNAAAEAFLKFLKGEKAVRLIRAAGYRVPQAL